MYLDDIMVFSTFVSEHVVHLKAVFDMLREHRLMLKQEKCIFGCTEIEFLGHIVGNRQVRMDHAKVKSILDWKQPSTIIELRAFLGVVNFYKKFIRGCLRLPHLSLNY